MDTGQGTNDEAQLARVTGLPPRRFRDVGRDLARHESQIWPLRRTCAPWERLATLAQDLAAETAPVGDELIDASASQLGRQA